jgi:asparagine synthase (glutamine-hydrolysing)
VIDLDTIQNFELATYLAGDLLVKEDRATMAHSLESRVPLLDVHVGQLAASTPQRQRATLRGGKRLLRSVARRRLPARRGRKHGFAVPLGALLDGPWAAEVDDWLRGSDSALINRHAAADLAAQRSAPAADVWSICALAAWEERVSEAKTAAAAAGAAMSAG